MGWPSDAGNWLWTRLHGGNATKDLKTEGGNAQYLTDRAYGGLASVGGRYAPAVQASQLAGGPQDQVRAQQMQQAGYLQGIIGGNQAGAGELAVNRQVGQANASQQAAMRSARGANAALAARNAMRNTADIGLSGAGQAAQAQMQDQQMASGQLGGLLAQTRGGDMDFASQNAQLAQQAALANQGATLQQSAMNDQATMGYLQQLGGMDQQMWERELQKRQLALGDRGSIGNIFNAGGQMLAQYAGQKRD